jgi:hypothetical protein
MDGRRSEAGKGVLVGRAPVNTSEAQWLLKEELEPLVWEDQEAEDMVGELGP